MFISTSGLFPLEDIRDLVNILEAGGMEDGGGDIRKSGNAYYLLVS